MDGRALQSDGSVPSPGAPSKAAVTASRIRIVPRLSSSLFKCLPFLLCYAAFSSILLGDSPVCGDFILALGLWLSWYLVSMQNSSLRPAAVRVVLPALCQAFLQGGLRIVFPVLRGIPTLKGLQIRGRKGRGHRPGGQLSKDVTSVSRTNSESWPGWHMLVFPALPRGSRGLPGQLVIGELRSQ